MEDSSQSTPVQLPQSETPDDSARPTDVAEVKRAQVWVPMRCWREGGKLTKRPTYDGSTLPRWRKDPRRWTFEGVEALIGGFRRNAPAGVTYLPGLIVDAVPGLIAVDIDAHRGPVDLDHQEVAALLALPTYIEKSIGGGYHVLGRGRLSSNVCRPQGAGPEIELLAHSPLAWTGNRVSSTDDLADLQHVVDRYAPQQPAAPPGPPAADAQLPDGPVGEFVTACLNAISPDVTYGEWFQVGGALKSLLGQEGWPTYLAWSARGRKFRSARECRAKFDDAFANYSPKWLLDVALAAATAEEQRDGLLGLYRQIRRGLLDPRLTDHSDDADRLPGARYEEIDVPMLEASVLDVPERIVVVQSDYGTGKTAALEQVCANGRVLVLTHRRALARQQATRLGVWCYLNAGCDWVLADERSNMVISLDSLFKIAPYLYENVTIIVDEWTQVLQHLTGDTCCRHRREIVAALRYLLTHARRIILLDADVCVPALGYVVTLAGASPRDIRHIRNRHTLTRGPLYRHASKRALLSRIAAELAAGRNVAIGSDSIRQAKTVRRWLMAHCSIASDDIAVVDGESSGSAEGQVVLANPDAQLAKCRVFVYTPAVSSGVSIQNRRFHAVFLLATGGTLAHRELLQMLARIRDADEYHVSLPSQGRAGRWTDPALMERELRWALNETCRVTPGGRDVDPATGTWQPADPQFLALHCRLECRQNRSFLALRERLLGLATERGYVVREVRGEAEIPQDVLTEAAEEVEVADVAAIMAARDIGEHEAENLRGRASTAAAKRELRKYHIRRFNVGSNDDLPLLVELEVKGEFSAIRAGVLAAEGAGQVQAQLEERDRHDLERNSGQEQHLRHHQLRAAVFAAVEEAYGTMWQEGFVPRDLTTFYESCAARRRQLQVLYGVRVTANDRAQPRRLLSRWLSAHGLRLERRRHREGAVPLHPITIALASNATSGTPSPAVMRQSEVE